ncbi:MAG: GMC family oxidoreductase [Burkholderiales bacterium]|nr:MAG: GMC family oxidoreductase [Burkholderiales bacterium]
MSVKFDERFALYLSRNYFRMTATALDQALLAGEEKAAGGAFDAIVVGGGAAGGLAAALLCEAGLQVLLLDAGHAPPFWRKPFWSTTTAMIGAVANPKLVEIVPHKLVNLGRKSLRVVGRIRQPTQSECFSWEQQPKAFVDDRDYPYSTPEGRPFNWIRSNGIGGRMVLPGHGRQYYRLGTEDLAPDDGRSPAWPLSSEELDPWYERVERRLQLAGRNEHVASPPDSVITRQLDYSQSERIVIEQVRKRWPDALPLLGRYAPPLPSVLQAAQTGRLACRKSASAQRITVGKSGRADGVEWRDLNTGRMETSSARLVFLCASTLESTRIMLMTKTAEGKAPGAQSGMLGRNLMDHLMIKAEGVGPKLPSGSDQIESGRCIYLTRFDRSVGDKAGARGFGVQLYATPAGSTSWFTAVAFAEVSPRATNHVTLDPARKNAWGDPTLRIDFQYSADEIEQSRVMVTALRELAEATGAKLDRFNEKPAVPGTSIHECGTARMGAGAAESVLDPHNECWDLPGLFVTDGSSFPSQGAQNPTLTIMALTARACDHAVAAR